MMGAGISIKAVTIAAALLVVGFCAGADETTEPGMLDKESCETKVTSRVTVTVSGKELLDALQTKLEPVKDADFVGTSQGDSVLVTSDTMGERLMELLDKARALMTEHPGRIQGTIEIVHKDWDKLAGEIIKALEHGQEWFDKGEYEKAIDEWNRVLLVEPTNKRAIDAIRLAAKRSREKPRTELPKDLEIEKRARDAHERFLEAQERAGEAQRRVESILMQRGLGGGYGGMGMAGYGGMGGGYGGMGGYVLRVDDSGRWFSVPGLLGIPSTGHYAYAEGDREHAAELEGQSTDLAQQYKRTSDEAERAELASKLKANLDELFDLRLKGYEEKISGIERELQRLRTQLDERKNNKELIVTGKFKELVGQYNHLRW